ncbi:MAG: sigma-70 family RNA polymerase sigma factor [Bacteroidales bacterium]|nr:sigma-70 family RNA polymerase sigma factor [Bacteroidales bacterium]
MEKDKDIRYIRQVLAGRPGDYAFLVNRYKNMVFNISYRILRNNEDAEEAAQDVFLKAYQALSSFSFNSKFSTWLYRIAYNTAISRTRKFMPEKTELDDSLINRADDPQIVFDPDDSDEKDQLILLEKALQNLEAGDNSLICMYYKDDLNIEEISKITGYSESNVKVRLFRIRKKIRDEIFCKGKPLPVDRGEETADSRQLSMREPQAGNRGQNTEK